METVHMARFAWGESRETGGTEVTASEKIKGQDGPGHAGLYICVELTGTPSPESRRTWRRQDAYKRMT